MVEKKLDMQVHSFHWRVLGGHAAVAAGAAVMIFNDTTGSDAAGDFRHKTIIPGSIVTAAGVGLL